LVAVAMPENPAPITIACEEWLTDDGLILYGQVPSKF
jgi:hypothetical protein